MTTTAFAANDGAITINEATVGQVYKLYKIFDATTKDGNTAYSFTKTGTNAELYAAITGEKTPFILSATADENVFNVTLKEGIVGSEIAVFLKGIEDKMGIAIATQEADSTTIEFVTLKYGYYYIAKETSEKPGATVGVTSIAPAQIINDKSTKPGPVDPVDPDNPGGYKVFIDENGELSKESNTANYGDTVTFVLQAKATNYDDGKKIVEYTAYDLLGEGFKDFNVTKVTVNDTEIANYVVDTAASPATITIPWTDGAGDHLYAHTATIKIYCQAVVGEEAVIGETGSNTTNTGWFGWEYDTKEPETGDGFEDKSTVTTKIYAIAIHKTDAKGKALAGAQFEIYKGNTKVPVTLVSEGNETNASVYKYDAGSTNFTVVSPTSGKIVMKGLEGVEYILKETVAPAGYNLLSEAKTIAATEFSSSTTTMTLYFDENGNLVGENEKVTEEAVDFDVASAAVNIINQSGTELPSTGGIGTKLFYTAGGILVAAAIIFIVTKKRMNLEA